MTGLRAEVSKPPTRVISAMTYTVRQGDTLYDIAHKFHTTVPRIKMLSGIRSNSIKPGQKLRIPRR